MYHYTHARRALLRLYDLVRTFSEQETRRLSGFVLGRMYAPDLDFKRMGINPTEKYLTNTHNPHHHKSMP
ncbi:hypothetical protein HCTV5_19 [Halovirus HCTV-5]|uniref:hypothetical protein n=1 Tax=Halovirus HCTV-5 TaxID=1273748 RepID=UPI0003348EC6|nr:hypothetical protein M200_gp019 [Halovirus HCTV-5]AGM11774.1 hypothetical protein HCTV5_19 [Halovirus HCTV-5]